MHGWLMQHFEVTGKKTARTFLLKLIYDQGSDSDDMSSFFSCEIDDVIQYINLGYGAEAPKIIIL
jgi:hypothetical protein